MTATLFDRMAIALEKATYELNAIRARDGAPVGISWGPSGPMEIKLVSEVYFGELVDECTAVLSETRMKP